MLYIYILYSLCTLKPRVSHALVCFTKVSYLSILEGNFMGQIRLAWVRMRALMSFLRKSKALDHVLKKQSFKNRFLFAKQNKRNSLKTGFISCYWHDKIRNVFVCVRATSVATQHSRRAILDSTKFKFRINKIVFFMFCIFASSLLRNKTILCQWSKQCYSAFFSQKFIWMV